MCMEDIQIGRSTQTFRRKFTLSTSSLMLLPNNPQRFSVNIQDPSSGIVWVMPGATNAFGQGYTLVAGDRELVFRIQHDGQQVTGEWWAIADAGAPVLWVIEEWFRPGTAKFPADYPGGEL